MTTGYHVSDVEQASGPCNVKQATPFISQEL